MGWGSVRLARSAGGRRSLAAVTAVLLAGALLSAAGPAQAAGELVNARIDLRVLVVSDRGPATEAIVAQLEREAVPYTLVDLTSSTRPTITTAFLEDAGASRARFQGVVLPNQVGGVGPALSAAELAAVQAFERKYGVRQVDSFVYPGSTVGMNPPSGLSPLDGQRVDVTPAAKADGFGYLRGTLRIDDFDPNLSETTGYLATPLATQAPGDTFTPLLTVGSAALAGVFASGGREELVLTANYNATMQWVSQVAPGIVTWLTRGVHLGYQRNYFAVQVDDVLLPDSRWSVDANCTPGDEYCTVTTPDIKMLPADVDRLVQWQQANDFRVTLTYNSLGADPAIYPDQGLTAALLARKGEFSWLSHTKSHTFLGCIQIAPTAAGQTWRCATSATDSPRQDPAIPGAMSGGTYWAAQAYIEAEVADNAQWAADNALPDLDASALVPGEHSGLKVAPQQPADSPFFGPALAASNVAYVAADASRELAQRPVDGAPSTLTVPRYPMNVFYNVATFQEEVDEYNSIYGTTWDASTNAAAQAAFTTTLVPLEVRTALTKVLGNDPRPFYVHQSNLAEDRILYPVLEGILTGYRSVYASNTPLVTLSLSGQGRVLTRQAAWATASAGVTGYLTSTGAGSTRLTITGAGGAQVPVTVPTGSTGAPFEPYAGELSAWTTATSLTVPDVGYGSFAPGTPSAAPGDRSAALTWAAPQTPMGNSPVTDYVITPFVDGLAQPSIATGNTGTSFTVTGLRNGTAYTFTVAAKNGYGTGLPSAPSAAVTPVGKPGAPTDVRGTAGDGQVRLTWSAPADTGGTPVTSYTITPYAGGVAQPAVTTPTADTARTMTGLANGTPYTFTVAATNAQGTGPASAGSAPVTPAAASSPPAPKPPAANPLAPTVTLSPLPRSVAPVALRRWVTYRWTASNPAQAAEYRVYVRRAAFGRPLPADWRLLRTVTGTSTALRLAAGQTAQVAVQAVTATGAGGALSASSRPVTRPLGVAGMTASRGLSAWRKVRGPAYFERTALQTGKRGATLALPRTRGARTLVLLAATARRAGSVDVFVGGVRVGSVTLSARKAVPQRTFTVRAGGASGKVVVKVRSSGRPVRVSGLAALS